MLVFAAISGFVFVALGAFGAHVLSGTLGANEMASIRTGLEYQGFHTTAIGAGGRDAAPREPVVLLERSAVGVRHRVVQRQPLLPALSHLKVWVYITPVGGVCFLIGWILMLIGALRLRKKAERHE